MSLQQKQILLIEDNPADALVFVELVSQNEQPEFTVQTADRISEALKRLHEHNFDVILLDLSLPDGSGKYSINLMCSVAPQIPIIVLTGLADDALALEAVRAGAQDYLVKGQVNGQILTHAIHYAIERKRAGEHLQYQATHDSLTGLPNRTLFRDRLAQAVERARRGCGRMSDKWEAAVMLLDLDHFKLVNDTLGHTQGDCLLKAVAARLKETIRACDTVARIGGDEFTLIFENLSDEYDITAIADKLKQAFAHPFELGEHCLEVTASIGISLYPIDGEDVDTLLKYADIAMYHAKRARNSYCFYRDCHVER